MVVIIACPKANVLAWLLGDWNQIQRNWEACIAAAQQVSEIKRMCEEMALSEFKWLALAENRSSQVRLARALGSSILST